MRSPRAIVPRPVMIESVIAVCTASSAFSRLPSPMERATMTFDPSANPANRLMIIATIAPVVPMAPMAPSTCERPTMIMSAAL